MHAETDRWVTGDQFGQAIPADPDALRSGGPRFLTHAFRVSGVLAPDNAVTDIRAFREMAGGSTGRKVVLSVAYDKPLPELHTELFVKFSRDFDDPTRDRGKKQMEPEVRFAALSRAPGFPIAIPRVLFGDYHRRTGTGLLITERFNLAPKELNANITSAWTTRCPTVLSTIARCSRPYPAWPGPTSPGVCRLT